MLDNVSAETTTYGSGGRLYCTILLPITKRFEEGHGFTFHGHEVVGAKMVPKIFARLKLPLNDKMRMVQNWRSLHLRPSALPNQNITDSATRRLLFEAGDDIDSLYLLCNADITSKNRQKVKRYLENFQLVRQRMKEVEEKITCVAGSRQSGGELILCKPSGCSLQSLWALLKDAIRDAILDGIISNDYESTYRFMIDKAASSLNLHAIE